MTRRLRLAHQINFCLVLAIGATHCSRPAVEEPDTAGPISVRTAPATLDLIQTSITVTGAVTPAPGADWTITAPDTGRILELPKAEGDPVKTGDVLAKFDVPSLTADLAARQSESSQAGIRLQSARSNVTRLTALVDRGIVPQRELDDSQRELIEAESAMRQADAAREAVEALAAGTLIRARFDGVVLRRWHNPGDSVDATTADPVLRVVDPTRIEVTGIVPASQLGLIAPGRAARIFNPTDGGEITGVVITRPALSENMAAGEVRISFGAAAPALPIGTPVQAEIIGDSQTNVLAVPSLAVFHDGDQIFVVVAGEDGRARRQPVSTGIVTRDKTQIMSGLKAGDLVILSGADPVADGAAITVVR